mmetsp:Transcript_4434/g.11108  ORF Transcript_4434/g.11108 Transcript_4434/m.11108 type:complete len:411 (+) Transcript_4434:41-1273(+)
MAKMRGTGAERLALVLLCLCMCLQGCSSGRSSCWGKIPHVSSRVQGGQIVRGGQLRPPALVALRGGGEDTAAVGDGQNLAMPLLRNLLDFSTKITNVSETPRNLTLDPERMQFLNNAMKAMIENTTSVFRDAIDSLSLSEDDPHNVRRKEVALENIAERVDHFDLAQGLKFLGGLQPVIDCLESPHSSIRGRAADAVAVACQNHEDMQNAVTEMKGLDRLASIYANRTEPSEVRTKVLYAISSLVQTNSTNQLSFLYNQGLAMLRADMQVAEPRLRRKAVFLLTQLMSSNPMLRTAVLKVEGGEGKGKGVLPELVAAISFPDYQVSEFACRGVLQLVKAEKGCGEALRKQFPELLGVLSSKLDQMLKDSQGHEEDEVVMVRELLSYLGQPRGFRELLKSRKGSNSTLPVV